MAQSRFSRGQWPAIRTCPPGYYVAAWTALQWLATGREFPGWSGSEPSVKICVAPRSRSIRNLSWTRPPFAILAGSPSFSSS